MPSARPSAQPRVRVLLLLPSLHGGGAERVAVHLMRHVDRSRFDMRMGLLRKSGPYLPLLDSAELDVARVGERFLDFDRGNSNIYRASAMIPGVVLTPANVLGMLRRFEPHVVLSFRKGMSFITLAAIAMYGRSRLRWIAREGNNTLAVIEDEVRSQAARASVRQLTRFVYRSADRMLTVCDEMARDLAHDFDIESPRLRTIHNAVDISEIRRRSLEIGGSRDPVEPPFIVAVGRLEYQKGFDVLLRAYAASEQRKTHRLVIVGEGSQEAELRSLAASLGIAERVDLLGWRDNPWALMRRASLFVLPSRWEGFGNVVIEAAACGLPLIVSDCAYGPKEIVRDGQDGLVTPLGDADALRSAIDRVLGNPELRLRLAAAAVARARTFDVTRLVERYQNLFLEVARELPELQGSIEQHPSTVTTLSRERPLPDALEAPRYAQKAAR